MIGALVNFLTSLFKSGSSYAVVGACAVCFMTGMHIADKQHEKEKAAAELEYATALAEQGKMDYEKLVAAQNLTSELRADADRMRADLDRLRKQAARREQPSAASCRHERDAVARCEKLLSEGSDLLAEGSDLLGRNAALHDGAIKARE